MSDTPPAMTVTGPTPGTSPDLIGFLSTFEDAGGVLGGYLVTNSWGRPIEFRLSTAVQPNRVQQILYGPTLGEYVHAELIGKTLVEKTSARPGLIVADSLAALGLRSSVESLVVGLAPGLPGSSDPLAGLPSEAIVIQHARSSEPLVLLGKFAADRPAVEAALAAVDPAVDLSEPFSRIREAVTEARKLGVTNRAA